MNTETPYGRPVEVILPAHEGRNDEEERRDGRLYLPEDGVPWIEVPEPFFDAVPEVPAATVRAGFPSFETTDLLMDERPTLHCMSTGSPHRYTLCETVLRGSPTIGFGGGRSVVDPSHYWADTIVEGAWWSDQDLKQITSVLVRIPSTEGIMPVDTPWSERDFGDENQPIHIPGPNDLNQALEPSEEVRVDFSGPNGRRSASVRFAVAAVGRTAPDLVEVQTGLVLSAEPLEGETFDLRDARRLVTLLHGFLQFCTGQENGPFNFRVTLRSGQQAAKMTGPFWHTTTAQAPRSERTSTRIPRPPIVHWWKPERLRKLMDRWFALSMSHADAAATFRSQAFLPSRSQQYDPIETFRERISLLEDMRADGVTAIVDDDLYKEHLRDLRTAIQRDARIDQGRGTTLLKNLAHANRRTVSLERHLDRVRSNHAGVLGRTSETFPRKAAALRHALAHGPGRSGSRFERAHSLNPTALLFIYVRVLEDMRFTPSEIEELMLEPHRNPYWRQIPFAEPEE